MINLLLRDGYFLALSLNHFAVDLLNSQRSILLVYLAPYLGLDNSDIGLVALGYAMLASLTQPLFGWLADRYKIRWISGLSLLWMVLWFSVTVTVTGSWVIGTLIVASLGSAAFHAAGTERATTRGKRLLFGKAATAASLFFLFGQLGLAVGPAIGGALLERMGTIGVLALTVASVPLAINSIYRLYWKKPLAVANPNTIHDRKAESSDEYYKDVWVIIAFCVLVMFRTAPQVASMTFLPKLFYDRGYDPGAYGIVTTVFMGGTAIGGLIGGFMSDRWGRRRIIHLSLLAAVIPMYYYPVAQGLAVYILVFLAGFFNGGSHAVIVVIAQSLLPNRRALASGLTMGFMFASGALGSYLIGLAADYYSLVNAMQINGLLCLLAAGLSLVLRRDDKKTLKASI